MLDILKKWSNVLNNNKNSDMTFEIINNIFYPDEESIIKLHDYIIKEFRFRDDPVFEGILSRSVLSFHGIKHYEIGYPADKRRDILTRGVKIFNKFLQEGHPFVDGNKRTGFITLWTFLFFNKFLFTISTSDYKIHTDLINSWADSLEDKTEEIYEWVDKHTKSI